MRRKVKFVNRTAGDLGDQMGIPMERRRELSHHLDDMSTRHEQVTLVPVCDVISEIEDFCNTQEEFVWALTNHIQFLFKKGRMIPPFKKSIV